MKNYITDITQAQTVLADNNIQLITFSQNVSYDTFLAQHYFDDFIKGRTGFDVQSFGNRSYDYIVVYSSDFNKRDKYFKVSHLRKMKKDELIDLCDSLNVSYYDCDTKSDLIDNLMNIDYEDYYSAHYASSNFYDLDCDLDITGYSQGDRVKIKLLGDEAQSLTDEGMTNLFYDCPISGSIDVYINGVMVNELYVDEFLPKQYDYYDKDDFIKYAADYVSDLDYKDILIEWLEYNMPTNLEYSS